MKFKLQESKLMSAAQRNRRLQKKRCGRESRPFALTIYVDAQVRFVAVDICLTESPVASETISGAAEGSLYRSTVRNVFASAWGHAAAGSLHMTGDATPNALTILWVAATGAVALRN